MPKTSHPCPSVLVGGRPQRWRADRFIATLALARLCRASGANISPGPYRSFRELSLAGSVDPDIWCPPTFVGNSGIECFNGVCGFALYFRVVARHPCCGGFECVGVLLPRKRGIQYAAALLLCTSVSGIPDHPLLCAAALEAGDDCGAGVTDVRHAIESRASRHRARQARGVERQAARGG